MMTIFECWRSNDLCDECWLSKSVSHCYAKSYCDLRNLSVPTGARLKKLSNYYDINSSLIIKDNYDAKET